jgi:hypothetical protein
MQDDKSVNETILPDGTKEWHRDGKRHRDGGPAIEWFDGTKVWFREGQLHREDGPAYEGKDGEREWHLFGQELPRHEFNARVADMRRQEQERDVAAKAAIEGEAALIGEGLQQTITVRRPLLFRR